MTNRILHNNLELAAEAWRFGFFLIKKVENGYSGTVFVVDRLTFINDFSIRNFFGSFKPLVAAFTSMGGHAFACSDEGRGSGKPAALPGDRRKPILAKRIAGLRRGEGIPLYQKLFFNCCSGNSNFNSIPITRSSL